ncbi:MAG: cell division protein FtsX, partial [Acidimicrobiia bacterium]|nr:cell division protein FtsX [Acidimicrobiia bacterium]
MVRPLRHKLLRDIGRQRAQFIAIAITMFLGVTIFAATYDSYRNLQASYDTTATEFHFANLTVSGGDTAAIAAEARAADGVESVELRSTANVPFQIGDVKLLGRVVGIPPDREPAVNRLRILEGGSLSGDGAELLIEKHMSDHFGLRPGDSMLVLGPDGWIEADVAGTVSSPEYIWPSRDRQELITSPDNFGVAFASEDLVRSFIGGEPNEVIVYYDGGAENEKLSARLGADARSLGAGSVLTRAEQASNAALSEDLKGFEEMAVFFPIMFLTAAAMAAYVMISRLVHAQRPHIGVLVASGFTR